MDTRREEQGRDYSKHCAPYITDSADYMQHVRANDEILFETHTFRILSYKPNILTKVFIDFFSVDACDRTVQELVLCSDIEVGDKLILTN